MSKRTHIRGNYMVIRYYENGANRVLRKNVTEDDAIAHCNRPETSSSTSKRIHSQDNGRWFDGYRDMRKMANKGSRMPLMEQFFVANVSNDVIKGISCRNY